MSVIKFLNKSKVCLTQFSLPFLRLQIETLDTYVITKCDDICFNIV